MKETNIIRLHLKFEKKLLPEDILTAIKEKKLISSYSNCFPLPTLYYEDSEIIIFSFDLTQNSRSDIWLKTEYWRNIPFQVTTEVINKSGNQCPTCKVDTTLATKGQLIIVADTRNP